MSTFFKQAIIFTIIVILGIVVLHFFCGVNISQKLPWSGVIICVGLIVVGIIRKYRKRK